MKEKGTGIYSRMLLTGKICAETFIIKYTIHISCRLSLTRDKIHLTLQGAWTIFCHDTDTGETREIQNANGFTQTVPVYQMIENTAMFTGVYLIVVTYSWMKLLPQCSEICFA